MKFTDIFIKKPVLASVVSLVIFFVGLRSIYNLPIRQFPELNNTVVQITTVYPGANAELVQEFITTLLQRSIASADGIDYLSSTSQQSLSQINAYIRLGFDGDAAFTEIMSKVTEVRNRLPQGSEIPVITKMAGATSTALLYIAFNSPHMSPEQISDYLIRVVQPELESLPGVAKAQILGATPFAMRIHLDAKKMPAMHMTPKQVFDKINENHFLSASGKVKGDYTNIDISATTDVNTANDFGALVIAKNDQGALVHLRDIAQVELGAENYNSSVIFNGQKATFFGITATPDANPLSVINVVRAKLSQIQNQLPPSLKAKVAYDATKYIRAALFEVIKTIIEAGLIVVLVIFLFLGSFRAMLIPVVTIPLSLVGACSLMLFLGYSLNLLTLLAMVLAIGLVVDDAIVVLENVRRHMEETQDFLKAALEGAREIALPIISMTLTLAAVYAPIGFLGGVTGSLFKEFAFTLASTVIISGIVALTLSPMMCYKLLPVEFEKKPGRFAQWAAQRSSSLQAGYSRILQRSLTYRPISLLTLVTLILMSFYLYTHTAKELAPQEDQNVVFMASQGPEYANINYMKQFTAAFQEIASQFPEVGNYFSVSGMGAENQGFSGFILTPWKERKRSQKELIPLMQAKLDRIAGLRVAAFGLPPLPTSGRDLPIQFVLKSTGSFSHLLEAAENLLAQAKKANRFIFLSSDLRVERPQLNINLQREKAALLGIDMSQIGRSLAAALSENDINRFSMGGQSYKVIPILNDNMRRNPSNIANIYLKTKDGKRIPLENIADLSYSVEPNQLTQFQQLNSVTLSGVMQPGQTIADGLNFLRDKAQERLPGDIQYDYAGQSRQYVQEGQSLTLTFFFALMVIFLVLAAQFESFRSPWIILMSIPLSAFGALVPMNLGLGSINIYSQVGLVTLIGLISKHGILIVEFANKLREREGLGIREAVERAAAIRLRPILMTTAATVMGVTPLLLSSGAGAESRFSISLVIVAGMLFGTLCTLFIIPAVYTYIAKE